MEDRSGNLWIGTYGGGLTRHKDGSFTVFTTEQGLANNVVRSLYEDKAGVLWVGTDGGLTSIHGGKFHTLTIKDGLPNNIVRAITQDREGGFWIATYGGGVCHYKNGRFKIYTTREGLSHDIVYSILLDRNNVLWAATEDGLSRFSNGKFSTFGFKQSPLNQIACLYQDREGSLWLGTMEGGLARLGNGNSVSFSTADGLSDNFIKSIYEDQEGSLWVGTFGGGLNRFKEGKFINYTSREGLTDNEAWAIYEDREGAVWIGTGRGGANRLMNGEVTASYNMKNGLSDNSVFSFSEDTEGNFWMGTWGKGLNLLKDGKISTFKTSDGLISDSISSLTPRKAGGLWIGTDAGLSLYEKGKWTNYTMKDGLANDSIFSLLEDAEGTLWIGTESGGLNTFKNGKFTTYTTRDGLSSDFVTALYNDQDGDLWIGTWGGGLNRFKSGEFTRYTTREGLYDDNVFQILEDSGYLWMSCNKGVFRVKKSDLNDFASGNLKSVSSMAYGRADGMVSEECNGTTQPAGWRTRDGRLWFPTMRGVAVLDPRKTKINVLPPPLVIEQVIVDDRPLADGQTTISPGKERVEFHYTALSFLYPEKIRFKYKLEGYDKDWIDADTRRIAYYTHLSPGRYHFRVIACNNDGVWNQSGAVFPFYLTPFFYQTRWFYIVSSVLLAILVWVAISLRLQKIKAHEKELESLVRERTRQLQEANQALKQMADRDGLTDVANYRRLESFLEQEWRVSARNHHFLSVIMIDIDYFKLYNDTYGHQAGDDCLKQVARVLSIFARRASDLVARYGGEEFMVVLAGDTRLQPALGIAEKMRAAVEELQIEHIGSEASKWVTISLGVATAYCDPKSDRSVLIEAADQALYMAKRQGRNRVKVSHDDGLYEPENSLRSTGKA